MKVIIKVGKKSAYAHLNYKTFSGTVSSPEHITLFVDGVEVDFTFKEIIIVDFIQEAEANAAYIWRKQEVTPQALKLDLFLRNYHLHNEIAFEHSYKEEL
jgi:hypothetical protein